MANKKAKPDSNAILKWAPVWVQLFNILVTTVITLAFTDRRISRSTAITIVTVVGGLAWGFLLYVIVTKQQALRKTQRIATLAGLVVLPALAGALYFSWTHHRKPHPDKLAIAVAGFNSAPALAERAATFARMLNSKLQDSRFMDPDPHLNSEAFPAEDFHRDGDSSGDEPRAVEFGQQTGVHLVIWGEFVGNPDGPYQVKPRITKAYEWMPDTEPGEGVDEAAQFEAVLISDVFKATDGKQVSEQVETLAGLLVGAAYLRSKNMERASYFFSAGTGEAARLCLGQLYLRQAQRAKSDADRKAGLDIAVNTFQDVVKSTDEDSEITAFALSYLGEACRERASLDHGTEDLTLAMNAYKRSRLAFGADKTPWQLENNLGIVLYKLSYSQYGTIQDLADAIAAYNRGLGILGEVSQGAIPAGGGCVVEPDRTSGSPMLLRSLASLYKNRGSARFEWGYRLRYGHKPGVEQLECARIDSEKSLRILASLTSRDKKLEATVEHNLGNTFNLLAKEKPDEASSLLDTALGHYDKSIDSLTPGYGEYTQAQKDRAETYYDKGRLSHHVDSLRLAVAEYGKVILELMRPEDSEDLADSLRYHAKANIELFDLHQWCDLNCLREAISSLDQSENLFRTLGKLQDAADVDQDLIDARRRIH